ncbi:MAG: SDR family oxidoreductase [Rhodothalassiaceae bacterium]
MTLERAPALVTGAARRIGRHISQALAARGHAVVVHYNRSQQDAETLVEDIRGAGGRAVAVGADLRDTSATDALLASAAEALGRPVQILINNASVFAYDRAPKAGRSGWDSHMDVNAYAPFSLTQQLARGLAPDQPGLAVNIIDQRVWRLTPEFATYTLSKSVLWTMTKTLAQALAPSVRVMAIGPGPVLASVHQDSESFCAEAQAVPLQRGPALDEITEAVAFCIAMPSMTGQMLALDGGQHLAWQTPDVSQGRKA